MGRIQSCGFYRIFKVAFLLFEAPIGGTNLLGQFSNPAGHILTLAYTKITHNP